MKKVITICFAVLFSTVLVHAQKTVDAAIRVRATVQKSPASITLSWPSDSLATSFVVYRKAKDSISLIKNFAQVAFISNAKATSYTDASVKVGQAYEYFVLRNGTIKAYGYIYAGIEVNLLENRGIMELLIDRDLKDTLSTQISRLQKDLMGDGWMVISHYIRKKAPVDSVKNVIKGDYAANPSLRAVFLLGHIPVPYSGGDTTQRDGYPIDGHVPQHMGAWPTDLYYADMDGDWTDYIVDNSRGVRVENHNKPGDGKFDQNVIPTNLELYVGRVDLYDMPAFGTENKLMFRYLEKDHAFRTKAFVDKDRGLIADYWGYLSGEAFAASAYRSFSAMFADSVYDNTKNNATYQGSLTSGNYLWSYGCGGGYYNSCSGVGNSYEFAKDSFQTVFTMLFGSYFGDWDNTDNILRAPLAAKGTCLANAWSGRPVWQMHHMAMGEPIGYSAWVNQNDYSNYVKSIYLNTSDRLISVNLMGDPSLRMHYVKPARNLKLKSKGLSTNLINWNKSTDNGILGYYVYRMNYGSLNGFYRVTPTMITDTFMTDIHAPNGKVIYMVRAVKLQQTASGTYFNLSQGIMDTLTSVSGIAYTQATINELSIYPNPSQGRYILQWDGSSEIANGILTVTDITGRAVLSRNEAELNYQHAIQLDISSKPAGVYLIHLQTGNSSYTGRVIKQ